MSVRSMRGAVFALQRHRMAGGVQHHHGHRRQAVGTRGRQRAGEDRVCLGQGQA
jgi:hypothetical protein